MPRRPDGRIEQGQRLSTAISARAWNRAQDAADIVLGERTGFGAEGPQTPGVRRITVRIPAQSIDNFSWPSGVFLRAGHAVGMPPISTRAALRNTSLPSFNPANIFLNAVANESDLKMFTVEPQWLDASDMGLATESFGVIESISEASEITAENPTSYYTLTCVVSGVFVCRAIAFGGFTDRLLGPPPLPSNTNLRPVWRPYPVMAPVGTARVLAIGAYWRVGTSVWPRVVECLVSM
jgi:hypothetical protein